MSPPFIHIDHRPPTETTSRAALDSSLVLHPERAPHGDEDRVEHSTVERHEEALDPKAPVEPQRPALRQQHARLFEGGAGHLDGL